RQHPGPEPPYPQTGARKLDREPEDEVDAAVVHRADLAAEVAGGAARCQRWRDVRLVVTEGVTGSERELGFANFERRTGRDEIDVPVRKRRILAAVVGGGAVVRRERHVSRKRRIELVLDADRPVRDALRLLRDFEGYRLARDDVGDGARVEHGEPVDRVE